MGLIFITKDYKIKVYKTELNIDIYISIYILIKYTLQDYQNINIQK